MHQIRDSWTPSNPIPEWYLLSITIGFASSTGVVCYYERHYFRRGCHTRYYDRGLHSIYTIRFRREYCLSPLALYIKTYTLATYQSTGCLYLRSLLHWTLTSDGCIAQKTLIHGDPPQQRVLALALLPTPYILCIRLVALAGGIWFRLQ